MQTAFLSDEDIRQKAPAVFALNASERMSDRYKFIPTIDYVNALRERNWSVISARQPNTRRADPNTVKHLITMVHNEADYKNQALGYVRPQISLMNSHNGTTVIEGIVSLAVKVCGNGLFVSQGDFAGFRFRHNQSAKEVADVLNNDFFNGIDPIIEAITDWQQIEIDNSQQMELATFARNMRFGDDSEVDPMALLNSRRPEDNQNTLWKTFNRVQENMVRGGIALRPNATKKSRGRQLSGELTNISVEVDYNRRLWDAARQIALQMG